MNVVAHYGSLFYHSFFFGQVGAQVEAKHPDKAQFFEATINKIQDCSQYTVGKFCISLVKVSPLNEKPNC